MNPQGVYLEPQLLTPWQERPPRALPLAASGAFFDSVRLAERTPNGKVTRRLLPLADLPPDLRTRAERFAAPPPPSPA